MMSDTCTSDIEQEEWLDMVGSVFDFENVSLF